MEAADGDLDAEFTEQPRDIDARGIWFDCTPTSITMPAPAASIMVAMRRGRMRVLVSSNAWMSIGIIAEHAAFGAIAARGRKARPVSSTEWRSGTTE